VILSDRVSAGLRQSVGEFGEKFRKERERRGLTLDDVSSVTKINSRMLKAIETEHFDQLPGGVFNKGFVRAYAKHLGLNDEEAVTEYLAVLREAQIGAQTAEWQPGLGPRADIERGREAAHLNSPTLGRKSVEFETKPPIVEAARQVEQRTERERRLASKHQPSSFHAALTGSDGRVGGIQWKIPVIVLAILVAVGMFWGRHSRNARAEQANAPQENTMQTARSAGVSADANPTPSDPKAAGTAAVSEAPSPRGGSASPSASPDPKVGVQSTTTRAKQTKNPGDEDVTVRQFVSNHAAAEAAKAPAALSLVIRATETSWILVTADGQVVNQETLIAPAHTSARANREIVVKAGNAAGVSFLLNGKEIPAQGDEGEVKTYLFDSAGMRILAPGQASGTDP
jgi:cytoskeletal protein RodZ